MSQAMKRNQHVQHVAVARHLWTCDELVLNERVYLGKTKAPCGVCV